MSQGPIEELVCHIWELPTGPLFVPLLEKVNIGPNLSVVLMVDLSQPTKLWHSIKPVLLAINEYIKSREDKEKLQKTVVDNLPVNHKVMTIIKHIIKCRRLMNSFWCNFYLFFLRMFNISNLLGLL